MSTAPRVAAHLPRVGDIESAGPRRVGRLLAQAISRMTRDLRSVPRYLIRYAVIVLALFGGVGLWEAHGDGRIPRMVPLMGTEPDPHRVSALHCAQQGVTGHDRWQGLAAALAILDDVNPSVASWVRGRHERGALVFSDRYSGAHDKQGSLARFDQFRRTLTVQRALFEEKDGEIAAVLCHEYRHSRQNAAKLVKCVLSFVVTADGDRSILENDAQLYEHEARLAIFRR